MKIINIKVPKNVNKKDVTEVKKDVKNWDKFSDEALNNFEKILKKMKR